jgi:purine-binding chemotaxis protein CheW
MACAVLRVGELRMALPLLHLYGIRRPAEPLCRLPNQPEWILGISTALGGKTQLVDTAALLGRIPIPGEYPDLHIVTVAPERWSLACNGIDKTVKVNPEDVRWRVQCNDDPWFAGIVTSELCPFIDLRALVAWLDARSASLL